MSSIVLEVPDRQLNGDSTNIGFGRHDIGGEQATGWGVLRSPRVHPQQPDPARQRGRLPEERLQPCKAQGDAGQLPRRGRQHAPDAVQPQRAALGDDPSDDAGTINGLADILLPDLLTYDTSSSQGFLNGRKLADDVIDAELGLISEGLVTTDCVPANDVQFPSSFPYLAAPQS